MSSPSSISEPGARSEAFARLHPSVQRWVYDRGWTTLHDAQERAIVPILEGSRDVIIAAATASGKTEAAFLPICSNLAEARDRARGGRKGQSGSGGTFPPYELTESTGVEVLYLSPLKALINDQFERMEQLCERVDVSVHRWHGDVSASAKQHLRRQPSGVLLITPESLEALFVNQGSEIPSLFAGLRYIVVDELHSFLSTPRGAQLQSLMSRVELAIRRRPPRVGLSATLGDMDAASKYLRPTNPTNVLKIVSESDQWSVRIQVRGYRAERPDLSARQVAAREANGGGASVEEVTGGDRLAIADHLYRTLRGTDNLVFANARRDVEIYADLLARRCERERVPNEFWPHHGSLAKDVREVVEAQLKDRTRPVTAICTSTLEMGIDIGSVASVAQIGTPPSVAGLRQRVGRSGRRGESAVLRAYITEEQLSPTSAIADVLRCELVQTVAMIRLLLAKWVEPPDDPGFNYSTLVQQVLSVIAQHGGATAAELHGALCGPGPFARVDPRRFAELLRAMAGADLLIQAGDGSLLHGQVGERIVNHYSFYAAFQSPEEWRLIAEGRTLGSLPISRPIAEGSMLIFAGRRWRITTIDPRAHVVELVRAAGGVPPNFGGSGAMTGDRVRAEMPDVYRSEGVPTWLNEEAKRLLDEGRAGWRRLELSERTLISAGNDTVVLPWVGDRSMVTTSLLLGSTALEASAEGAVLTVTDCSPTQLTEVARNLLRGPLPDPSAIARRLENTELDKWDWVLDEDLGAEAAATRLLDIEGAWHVLDLIAGASEVGFDE